jgi:hypothetical protein
MLIFPHFSTEGRRWWIVVSGEWVGRKENRGWRIENSVMQWKVKSVQLIG